jgi:hypothetical protein
MATMTVTISGFTNNDIDYSPTDKVIKPEDTVTFTLQNMTGWTVAITWDSGCPMTSSDAINLDGDHLQPVNRTVSQSAANGLYNFTASFESNNPTVPGTEEEPEEGPSQGGLEVSRDN